MGLRGFDDVSCPKPPGALGIAIVPWSFRSGKGHILLHNDDLACRLIRAPLQAFYPGMMFILGSWYTKEELGKRTMFFGTGNQISGAFGGLIAGAIAQNLDGAGGLRGWRWLFIIEGLIGVTVGLAGYFLLPNFPHNTSWISEEERQLAVQRQLAQGKKVVSTAYNWRT